MNNNDEVTKEPEDCLESTDESEWIFAVPKENEVCPHFYEGTLFENATLEASSFVQVDYEMAVSSALGVVAACCQGLVDVAYPNGHVVPTSLMIMTLAGVSEGKTSLDNEFSRPIREFEKRKDQERRKLIQRYLRDMDIWKQKEKSIKKDLSKNYALGIPTDELEQKLYDLDNLKPEKPISYRFIYERATPSALIHSMYENLPFGYFLSDEAGSLLMGPAFEDICQFNSLWSGSDIPVDRRTSDSFLLSNARLSVNLMLQPPIFKSFLKHKRGQHAYESGFFARFLISCPKPTNQITLSERYSKQHIEAFHERALMRLEESISACETNKKRTVLTFNATAAETWKSLYKSILRETLDGRAYMHEKGHARKLMDNISRIAALLHTFECEDYNESEISKDSLDHAALLVRHFSGHFMREIAKEPEIVTLANSMIGTIRKHAKKNAHFTSSNQGDTYHFKMSDIKQYSHGDIRNTEVFHKVINFLEDLGHLSRNGSNSFTFKDTILLPGNQIPKIKNGELYHVKLLPRFDQQVSFREPSNGREGLGRNYGNYEIIQHKR